MQVYVEISEETAILKGLEHSGRIAIDVDLSTWTVPSAPLTSPMTPW